MGEAAAPLEGVKHLAPQICHHGWQIPEDTAAPPHSEMSPLSLRPVPPRASTVIRRFDLEARGCRRGHSRRRYGLRLLMPVCPRLRTPVHEFCLQLVLPGLRHERLFSPPHLTQTKKIGWPSKSSKSSESSISRLGRRAKVAFRCVHRMTTSPHTLGGAGLPTPTYMYVRGTYVRTCTYLPTST